MIAESETSLSLYLSLISCHAYPTLKTLCLSWTLIYTLILTFLLYMSPTALTQLSVYVVVLPIFSLFAEMGSLDPLRSVLSLVQNLSISSHPFCQSWDFFRLHLKVGLLGFWLFAQCCLLGVGLWFNVFAFVSNFFAWVWDHDGDFASRSMIVCVLFEIGTVKCSFSVITDHPGVCLSSICMFASVLWCWNFVELLKHFTNCKNFCTDSLIPPSPTGFIERLNVLSLFMIRSLMIRV